MQIQGKYIFNGPREIVYELLQEPEALAEAMPCTTTLKRVAEDVYDAEMEIRMGFTKRSFAGTVAVKEKQPPEHFKLIIEGEGANGVIKGEGRIDFEAQAGAKTLIRYVGETNIDEGISRAAKRLIHSVAPKMINSGLNSLDKRLVATNLT